MATATAPVLLREHRPASKPVHVAYEARRPLYAVVMRSPHVVEVLAVGLDQQAADAYVDGHDDAEKIPMSWSVQIDGHSIGRRAGE